jgi:hypothetical protein
MASQLPLDEPDPKWLSWPGLTSTAGRLGCSRNQIPRFVADGELVEVIASDKSKRYDPASIDSLAGALKTQQANEVGSGDTSSDVVRSAVSLLAQQQEYTGRLLQLTIDGFERALKVLTTANEQLSSEVTRLSSGHLEAVRAREEALNENTERRMRLDAEQAAQARRDKALDTILPNVPTVLTQVGQALSNWASGGTLAANALRLIGSFETAQLEALADSEFLSDEQKELIREHLKERAEANGNQEESQEAKPEEKQREASFQETTS